MQPGVFRLVHHTHAAATELFQNAVMGKVSSDYSPALSFCVTDNLHYLASRGEVAACDASLRSEHVPSGAG